MIWHNFFNFIIIFASQILTIKEYLTMLIVDARESESLDRAPKVFKRNLKKQAPSSNYGASGFHLPSVKRRTEIKKQYISSNYAERGINSCISFCLI